MLQVPLGVLLALFPVVLLASEESEVPIEVLRQQAADAAIQGCTVAIVAPAVRAFMKRSQDAGKLIATEAEALTLIESAPQWKSVVLPGIQRTCACVMEEQLQIVRAASTADELNSALSRLAGMNDPARMEVLKPLLVRCTQENLVLPAGKQ